MLEPIKHRTRLVMKDNVWSKAADILHEHRGHVSIPFMGSGALIEADDTVTGVLNATYYLLQDMKE